MMSSVTKRKDTLHVLVTPSFTQVSFKQEAKMTPSSLEESSDNFKLFTAYFLNRQRFNLKTRTFLRLMLTKLRVSYAF